MQVELTLRQSSLQAYNLGCSSGVTSTLSEPWFAGSITPLKKERVEKRARESGGLAMQCKQVNAEYGFVVAVTVSRREPFVR